MKILGFLLAFFFFYTGITLAQDLDNRLDSVSYSVGVIIAENLQKQGFSNLDESVIASAIRDIMNDNELLIGKKDADQIFKTRLKEIIKIMEEENRLAGESFLAENATNPSVKVLPSGLQYEIISIGMGAYPSKADKVKTHYHGTLIDGTVFDSSVERGEPIIFALNRVIKAWQEILPLMKEGDKWRIFAPYNLAYGSQSPTPIIKPYSALIFELELLEVISPNPGE